MTETTTKLRIMKGIGNKANWLFLADENYNIIRGFRTGGITAVRAHLERKYQTVTFGGFEGLGDARSRVVYVTPFAQVPDRAQVEKSADERALIRGRANAEMARTQLRNWK